MAKKLNKTAKIALIVILIVVCIGTGCGIFAIWASGTGGLRGTDIKIIAHRGYSAQYTENSASAFRYAADKAEFYGIETDVHMTLDGYLICNHDEELHFKDGTNMVIATSNLADLQSKPIKSKFGTEEIVPLFDEYLAICKEGGKRPIIEIKAPLPNEQLLKVIQAASRVTAAENITMISFHFDRLEYVRSANEKINLMYLVKAAAEIPRALHNNYSIGIAHKLVTPTLVADFHAKGLEVNAWTCNNNLIFSKMKKAGVDYITTDVLPKK